jgi:hypothetical protein
MQWGLNIENQKLINAKAKTKGDGIYSFRGVVYRVQDHHATHFADQGQILQQYGAFNVVVGSYDGYGDAARKLLKNIKD